MLTTLQTSYTDTRAGDLAWCLGKEPLPALAVLDLELGVPQGQTTTTGNIRVQLRLLGASHQVLLDAADGRFCSETVACMPGASTPLPFGVAERIGEWEYEFAARVETLSRGQFAGRAQELLALVAEHPHGLAGRFPGDPHAFTAMVVQRAPEAGGGIHWRTWHAYPQEGQLVATRSKVSGRLSVPGPGSGNARGVRGAKPGARMRSASSTAHIPLPRAAADSCARDAGKNRSVMSTCREAVELNARG